MRIAFFGHFGRGSFGNESTLDAVLYHLRRLAPDAEICGICTGPEAVTEKYKIDAVPSRLLLAERWMPRSTAARWVRRLLIGALGEPYQWLNSVRILRSADALLHPGSGILQDADTYLGWGPYDMFRWSMAAKLCRCRLVFMSVGAGPLSTRTGRFLVKTALSLADYRSYRDEPTRQLLQEIWPPAGSDPVHPDLAFSLPESLLPTDGGEYKERPVVGLGLMANLDSHDGDTPGQSYAGYVEALAGLARWLLVEGYDIRVLSGDMIDAPTVQEFRSLLGEPRKAPQAGRIIVEPIESADDLMRQLMHTDLVVATRFHNVLSALLLNKPVMAITFHHKCTSLMSQMGLEKYCSDYWQLDSRRLIEQFLQLSADADEVRKSLTYRLPTYRDVLDRQYVAVLEEIRAHPRKRTAPKTRDK